MTVPAHGLDAAQVAGDIGIDADSAVDYHADDIGTAKVFGAMSRRLRNFRSSPKTSSADDTTWRKELDEDFTIRK